MHLIFDFIHRDFVYVCSDALELNGTLITTEQKEYHESLSAGFQDIVDKLSDMFDEKVKPGVFLIRLHVIYFKLRLIPFSTCHISV